MQGSLLETFRPQAEVALLSPNDLPESGRRASSEMVANIRETGVHRSIVLIRSGDSYQFAEGRRCADAAKRAGIAQIPCTIYPEGTPAWLVRVITLSTNIVRAPNPSDEVAAIEGLIAEGVSLEQIADTLHLPIQTLRKRMKLVAAGTLSALPSGHAPSKLKPAPDPAPRRGLR